MSAADGGRERSRLSEKDVRAFNERLDGEAIHHRDRRYPVAAASAFDNPVIAWSPDLVVRCATAEDVQRSIDLASSKHMTIALRGGGVGWIGASPGSVLIDVRAMRSIEVDPHTATVHVQAGASWREVNVRLGQVGLAAAGPQFTRLSVAGYALGGGHGWLTQKLGWGSDTLRSVELVSAAGDLLRADAEREADLFWALRGAGHNMGAALSLELATMPLHEVHGGIVWLHPDSVRDAFAWYRGWAPGLPDEVTTILGVMRPPRELGLDRSMSMRPCPHVLVCHCGSSAQAARDLAALRTHRSTVADTVGRVPYAAFADGLSRFEPGLHRRSRMRYLEGLTDGVIESTVDRLERAPPLTMVSIHHYGGALARVPEDATAMSHRREAWNYMLAMTWTDDGDGSEPKRWQDELLAALDPWSREAMYVNYLCQEPDRVRLAYNTRTWSRLRDLKRTWDPHNRFADNHNIPPAAGRAASGDAASSQPTSALPASLGLTPSELVRRGSATPADNRTDSRK